MRPGLYGYAAPVDDQDDDGDSHHSAEMDEVLDRNWNELLQELRVTQTGTQILTGFLLTVPFSNGFPKLAHDQKILYLLVLLGSVIATGLTSLRSRTTGCCSGDGSDAGWSRQRTCPPVRPC